MFQVPEERHDVLAEAFMPGNSAAVILRDARMYVYRDTFEPINPCSGP